MDNSRNLFVYNFPFKEIKFEYDSKGNKVREIQYLIGFRNFTKNYQYDQLNNLTKMQILDDKNNILIEEVYCYEYSNLTNWKSKEITRIEYSENQVVTRRTKTTVLREFDNEETWMKETTRVYDGRQMNQLPLISQTTIDRKIEYHSESD